MYIVEHALLNIGKNKSRNILLGAIIFAIITSTVVALAIYNASGIAIDETRMALQCAVRIAPGIRVAGGGQQNVSGGQQIVGGSRQEAVVTAEQYFSFANSDYLDGADIKEGGNSADGVDAVYYLKRPDMLAAFETELRDKGLPENYSVKSDESTFDSVAGSVESLNSLALTFLIIVLLLGAVIMILLSFIAIRERKYEIGVLRAMGMKKGKVALGLWIEIIAVTCVCFALGMGAGAVLSQPVADSMLSGITQPSSISSTSLADRLSDANTGMARTEKIGVSVDGITALEIFGVSLLLASISGVISASRITKSEPIKILMERN